MDVLFLQSGNTQKKFPYKSIIDFFFFLAYKRRIVLLLGKPVQGNFKV